MASSKLSRARDRLAARKRLLAAAKAAAKKANAAVKKAQAAVNTTARTVKRLTTAGKPVVATGVDVSNHQGSVDWRKVKGAGYDFAYLKATEGVGFTDAFFHANVRGARAAGLKVGAYHFLRPRAGRTGAVEAKEFAAQLRKAGLTKGHGLRPVVDVEDTELSPAATETYVDSFVKELRRLTDMNPLIYTFPAFLNWGSSHGCPLWIAHFGVNSPTVPRAWKRFYIWQHSSTARVPGVNGNCDVNRCPDLRRLDSGSR